MVIPVRGKHPPKSIGENLECILPYEIRRQR